MKSENIVAYFNEQAVEYHRKSTSWPWAWLRHRESRAVEKMMGDVSGCMILDLGCGAGFYTRFFLRRSAAGVFAVDCCGSMLKQLPDSRVSPVLAEAGKICLNEKFSRIICAGLLEFVDDPVFVLRNAFHLAAMQTKMVLLVPVNNLIGRGYQLFHRRHEINIRLFDNCELVQIAETAGWKVIEYCIVFPFSLIISLKNCD
ncbi:MAG: class I SAM-dependent methyltransferase [Nitrospinaceae bacterium]|jgi:2-polyprenyl-3-methyl-5-hydroxy-6-metoxy-1,4-benzoquinol methylase|nr:class I SAM-dependent methyltransferase [Nitrospinaceae bacterium]|tara:strand:+ start:2383 stop:2985 length:603 start_codon:yes stop_codon:yes gene_type:complete